MKFDNYSDWELENEVKRRRKIAEENRKAKRIARRDLVLKHRKVLLQFMEEDVNARLGYSEGGGAYNHRSALEELGEWDDDIEIDVEIILRKVKD